MIYVEAQVSLHIGKVKKRHHKITKPTSELPKEASRLLSQLSAPIHVIDHDCLTCLRLKEAARTIRGMLEQLQRLSTLSVLILAYHGPACICTGTWKAKKHKAMAEEARCAWAQLKHSSGGRAWMRHVPHGDRRSLCPSVSPGKGRQRWSPCLCRGGLTTHAPAL